MIEGKSSAGKITRGSKGLREVRGNCLKYLKRWWNRKEGRGNKDFEMGVGGETPLRTMLMRTDE